MEPNQSRPLYKTNLFYGYLIKDEGKVSSLKSRLYYKEFIMIKKKTSRENCLIKLTRIDKCSQNRDKTQYNLAKVPNLQPPSLSHRSGFCYELQMVNTNGLSVFVLVTQERLEKAL